MWLRLLGFAFIAGITATAANSAEITVYKSPDCGCCAKWVDILRTEGHQLTVIDRYNMDQIKKIARVPVSMRSCHTALVEGYVIEGHVSPADITWLLDEQPEAHGLAVPGMPIGAPGMEIPDLQADPYETFLIDRAGKARVITRP